MFFFFVRFRIFLEWLVPSHPPTPKPPGGPPPKPKAPAFAMAGPHPKVGGPIHHHMGDPLPPPPAPIADGTLFPHGWKYSGNEIHLPEQQHEIAIVHGNINHADAQLAHQHQI